MDELFHTVMDTIRQHQMLKSGDTVIVACSGGADSLTLLHWFCTQCGLCGLTLRAAHVNHGIRGSQADADEHFVTQFCAAHEVPLDIAHLHLPPEASEATAREARYVFFESLAHRFNAKIATAHTQNDNAETVLLHLARGAGVHGAAGIPFVRGCYVRPLLSVTRAQVEAYVAQHGLAYRTDATNFTDAYARNRVRRAVLPALEVVHPAAQSALARFAADMSETAAYLDGQAAAALQQARFEPQFSVPGEPPMYAAQILYAAPPPVRKAALRSIVLPCADPNAATLQLADEALRSGGAVQLSPTCRLCVKQGLLRLEISDTAQWNRGVQNAPFRIGQVALWQGVLLTIQTQSYEDFIKFEKTRKKPLNFCADYDKINVSAGFRTRLSGDTFAPVGRGVTKPLKKLLSEARLSPMARMALPVLACGSTVLWAAGFGFAEQVRVGDTTHTVVEISIETEQTEEQNE